MPALGRRTPTDFRHVSLAPYALAPFRAVPHVKKRLYLPEIARKVVDQGQKSACVGGALTMGTVIDKSVPGKKARLYDLFSLWKAARLIDEDPSNDDPNTDEGTWVSAGCQVLIKQGHWALKNGVIQPVDPANGIDRVEWVSGPTAVDQVRTAISLNRPVVFGIPWYDTFNKPRQDRSGRFVWADSRPWGDLDGGHAICLLAADDDRQQFGFTNDWGDGWPRIAWMPYAALTRFLSEGSEVAILIDRPGFRELVAGQITERIA